MQPQRHQDASDGAATRIVALELLKSVLHRRQPLDEALAGHARLAAMEARDRAFVRSLVATTLRRLGQIDALIAACLERPLPARADDVYDLLRMGACQIVFLATAPHAAVNETVSLAEFRGQHRFKGLINAILRRLVREGAALVDTQDAARLNTPEWLWQSWVDAFGEPTTRAIAEAHLGEPPLDFSVKDDAAGWAARLEAMVLPTGTVRRPTTVAVDALPGYADGAWWIQDAAAALPARLLGPVAGRRVADLCAAPGGKTAQLAAAGARVIAVDRSARRLRTLQDNLARLNLSAETEAADATSWRPVAAPDAVLLDAPCTGTGTIRRHPDIARLKTPSDVARMAELQDRLLAAAVALLPPGGTLIYCTCSLQPEEGPERIAALIASEAPVERVPIGVDEAEGVAPAITPVGDLRTLPCHLSEAGGMDGFYAARLRRL